MVEMLQEGWTSGDCCVPASPYSLPLRMASEDLHLATVLGHMDAKPIAGRGDDEPPENDPSWINKNATHHGGLVFYQHGVKSGLSDVENAVDAKDVLPEGVESSSSIPVERIVQLGSQGGVKIAIENPFAWQVPVWLASGQVDGFFLLGDWLRLDRRVLSIADGRGPQGLSTGGHKAVGPLGRKNLLESAGCWLQDPPLGWNRRSGAADACWIQPPLRR